MHLWTHGGLLHNQLPSSAQKLLWQQMQPTSCLLDGVVAVVCSLLKDNGQVVDKIKL